MKVVLICVFAVIAIKDAECAMSEAQTKAAAKLLRNVCQPKTKISNAQIDAFHNGEFTEDHDVMCYMECTLRTGQIMKDGKLNYDSLVKQLATLPASISEGAIASSEHCKDAAKSSDKCTAAYEFYKCFYEDNPSNFFLP